MSEPDQKPPEPAACSAPGDEKTALARGAGINLGARFVGQGLQLLVQVLLARLLGQAAFGRFSIGWILLRLGGGMIAPLGLDDGVVRFSPRVLDRRNAGIRSLAASAVGMALLAGAVMGGLLFFLAPPVANLLYRDADLIPVLRALAPGFALLAALRVVSAATRITQRMQFSVAAEELAQPAAQCVLVAAAWALGGGAVAAAGATSLSLGLALALAGIFLVRLFPGEPEPGKAPPEGLPSRREMLAFSLPTMLAGLSLMTLLSADQLLVGGWRPASDVGIYRSASVAAVVLTVILSAFNTMISSQVAELHHRGDSARLAALFRLSARWSLYTGVPPFLVLFFAPAEVLSIFGAGYEGGVLPLRILALAHLAHVIAGPTAPLLILTGHPKRWSLLVAAALAANLLLNLLWIPHLGGLGAAIARACSLGGLALGGLLLVRMSLGFWPWNLRFVKGLIAAGLAGGILWVIRGVLADAPLAKLSLLALVGTSAFLLALAVFGLDADDREILRRVTARLQ